MAQPTLILLDLHCWQPVLDFLWDLRAVPIAVTAVAAKTGRGLQVARRVQVKPCGC